MSLKKNLLYNFLLSLSQVAFPLISIPYISRVLDPAGIGKVGTIDSLTYYFIVIAEFGIVSYGIREVSRKRDNPPELNKLVSELVSLHFLTSLLSAIIYSVFIFIIYNKIQDIRLVLFSVSFLLVNSFACEWYFWGKEDFKYITIRSLLTRVLGLAGIFILIKAPPDYFIYYAIISLTAIVNLVWNFLKMTSEVSLRFQNISWKKHIPFVTVTYKISLVYSIVIMLDNVFLRVLSTAAAVAYYAFAAKVVRIGGALVTDTLLVFYPRTVSLLHKNEQDGLQTTIMRSSEMIVLTTIPMAFGIYLLADKFTLVYFGNNFLPLAANLKILAFYPLIKSLSLFLNKQLLMPYDQEKLVLRGLTIGAVFFVASTIPLSFLYADKGTSVAIMLSELSVLAANLYFVQKTRTGVRLFETKAVLQSVAGSLLFLPLVYFSDRFFNDGLAELLVLVPACILVYIAFLLLVKNELAVSIFHSLRFSSLNLLQGGSQSR